MEDHINLFESLQLSTDAYQPIMYKNFDILVDKFIEESHINNSSKDNNLAQYPKRFGLYPRIFVSFCLLFSPFYIKIPTTKKQSKEIPVIPKSENIKVNDLRVLIPYNPFAPRGDRLGVRCPIRAYIIYISTFYFCIRIVYVGIYHIIYERKLTKWLIEVESSVVGPCIILSDNSRMETFRKHREQLDIYGKYLSNLGTLGAAMKEMAPFLCIGMGLVYALVIYLSVKLTRSPHPIADSITSLYDPELEKKHIDESIRHVIDIMLTKDSNQAEFIRGLRQIEGPNSLTWLFDREMEPCSCRLSKVHRSESLFTRYFGDKDIARFVVPRIQTATAYRQLIRAFNLFIIFGLLFAVILGGTTGYIFLYTELTERIIFRLHNDTCNKLGTNATPHKSNFILQPLEDPQDLRLYELYKNGTIGLWSLLFKVEVPIMISGWSSEFFFVLASLYISLSWTVGFTLFSLFGGRKWILIWLLQIISQLKICNLMLAHLSIIKSVGYCKYRSRLTQYQVESALLITYINFMCFKKKLRYYNYQLFHLTTAVTGAAITTLYASYLVSSEKSANQNLIQIIASSAIILVNLITYIGASLSNDVQVIFGCINDILAKSCMNNMEQTYIVSLWRRNALSSDEVQAIYGISLFSIRVTFSNIIEFNSYILAFTFFARKLV